MFHGCINLEELDICQWETGNLEEAYQMFAFCNNLKNRYKSIGCFEYRICE